MGAKQAFWERLNRHAAEWVAGVLGLIGVIAFASATSQAYGLGAGLLFVGLLAGSFLAIVVHELGHAIAAWLVGWRVWIISALPVSLRFGYRPRLTARFNRDVGGYVLPSPTTDAHDSKWRSIVVSAGGPLASAVTGAALIAWLMTFPREPWEQPHNAGLLGSALAFSFYSLSAAIMTIWPMRMSDGHPNDGGKIIATFMDRPRVLEDRALSWAWGLFAHGIEPSAWPHWMRSVVVSESASAAPSAMALYLGFAAAIEADDADAARALVRASSYDLAKPLRAYLFACVDDDPGAAEAELAAIREPLDWPGLLRFRAFALIRIRAAAGDTDGAQCSFDQLAAEIVQAPAPEPFWELLLLRARRDAIASRASPSLANAQPQPAGASAVRGPWGPRR